MEKRMQFEREQLEKLSAAGSLEEAMALAEALGMELDEDTIANARVYFEKKGALSDKELDNVAGGKVNWGNGMGNGNAGTPEQVRFAFNVGDIVETYQGFGCTDRGVITKRHAYERRFFVHLDYAASYTVRLLRNGYEHWFAQNSLSY